MSRRYSEGAVSALSDDFADYDIISEGQRSLESSIADLGHHEKTAKDIYEPPPPQTARENFVTPALSVEDIQSHVRRALTGEDNQGVRGLHQNGEGEHRVVRVYVDGKFDGFNIAHALQLRQAKLSFPQVHLLVGVYADSVCEQYDSPISVPHLERCELVRHCRWVDEVVPEAPWRLDEMFLKARRIDYVAIDEGTSVDPTCDKERLKGYDLVKSLRKAIPTKRTTGIATIGADQSRNQTPIPSRKGSLRGVPSTLRNELLEIQRKPVKELLRDEGAVVMEGEKDDSESPEPRVDEFGTGVGI